jgi:hypothetical protein
VGKDDGVGMAGLLLVDGLHKLADDQGHTLDALDLLLGADKLALQTPLLVLDVLLLQLDVLQMPLKLLECGILVSALRGQALDVLDVGDGGRDGLVVRRGRVGRVLYRNVAHGDGLPS